MPHRPGTRVLGRLLSHAGRPVLSRALPAVPATLALLAGVASAFVACGGGRERDAVIDVEGRQVSVQVPARYDAARPAPVVILLHGFGSSGDDLEDVFQLSPLAEEFGFLYMHPDGTVDCEGRRFWDASEVCCDACGVEVDDAGYLRGVIEALEQGFNVDDRRIYLVGHSNGAFMALRMACEHADVIAGVASLAGAGAIDPSECRPSEPIHVLQIHGTADARIQFQGGIVESRAYPGAVETAEQWASAAGCRPAPEPATEKLDLVDDLPGSETAISRYEKGCAPGGSATLWTIEGGSHSPKLSRDFGRQVVAYLLAHPKPERGS